jgi:hypothetical protein
MAAFQITPTLLLATFFVIISTKPIVEPRRAQASAELSSQSTITVAGNAPQSCPVTQPPRKPFVPPSPYPSQTSPDGFWFGSEKLWILLPTDGTWKHLPHYKPTDTAFRQKLQWWRQGYNWRTEHQPPLTVTGRRLDSSAAPLATDHHPNAADPMGDHASMMTGIFIPTVGCWQVTGNYKGDKLTFVIWVAP